MARTQTSGGTTQIAAAARPAGKHTARSVREHGGVPAVLYGHGEPVALTLGEREVTAIQHMPRNHVFPLKTDGGKAETVRLVAMQREATSGRVLHLDLERVVRGERSRVSIALVIVGEEALGRNDAVVTRLVDSLEIEGETMHLPPSVTVDVASLGAGDHVSAGDVHLPAGVVLLTAPDTPILQVGHAQSVSVEEPAAEGEGKAEGEAEATEAKEDKG
jgi:large subunit ribosomal protein L25